MVYHSMSKNPLYLFFFVILLNAINESSRFSLYFVSLTLIMLFLAIIRFTFKINDHLEYRIMFFHICIYKKEISPDQIVQMKFKRTGWSQKMAAIQLKKGLGIRVIDFKPETVHENLIRFAEKHDVSVSKSKDYVILEKLRWDVN
ncbi:hypothetical protein VBD025_16615 [Virgibacillus flavescens]|uniref:hypothetical protein n=1 Tax=Virgibacillus flavescens TaxID=1611422 RepID=UPI003D34D9EA